MVRVCSDEQGYLLGLMAVRGVYTGDAHKIKIQGKTSTPKDLQTLLPVTQPQICFGYHRPSFDL